MMQSVNGSVQFEQEKDANSFLVELDKGMWNVWYFQPVHVWAIIEDLSTPYLRQIACVLCYWQSHKFIMQLLLYLILTLE